MKNRFLLSMGFVLLLCIQSFTLLGQDVKSVVGKVVNRTATLTDEITAIRVLQAGLSTDSYVGNTRILGPDENGKYFLVGDITVNGKVNGKGIQLDNEGDILLASSGPGVEISCVGTNCSRCVLKFSKWKPYCVCEDPNPPTSAPSDKVQCDMISRYIVKAW